MKTIFKYQLSIVPKQTVFLPEDYQIVLVDEQGGELMLWAEVDSESNKTDLQLIIVGTGHSVPPGAKAHLHSIAMSDGLVWHVYRG